VISPIFVLKHEKAVVCAVVIAISSTALFFPVMTRQDSFASEYINYTNHKYQIEFKYPVGWMTSEKISRQDNGTDITITKSDNASTALLWIKYGNITALKSDIKSGLLKIFDIMNGTYPSKEFVVMEPPSFTTINGLKTGTFLYALADKYGESELDSTQQVWLTYVGQKYYLMSFITPLHSFFTPQNSEMLGQFLKSIKFLGHNQYLPPSDSTSTTTSGKDNATVLVNSSVTTPIMFDTINTKGSALTSSIMAFVNLGPDVLKGSNSGLPNVKTKINNEVNNVTQTVEGIKSTEAIMRVEINKALASIISLLSANQTHTINIETFSICKPSATRSDSCDNAVTIK
jgi:hypothetical protein